MGEIVGAVAGVILIGALFGGMFAVVVGVVVGINRFLNWANPFPKPKPPSIQAAALATMRYAQQQGPIPSVPAPAAHVVTITRNIVTRPKPISKRGTAATNKRFS